MSAKDEQPKIIIDSDWKSQAQAEKDRLAAVEAKADQSRPKSGPGGESGEMPPADFRALVGMLGMQALMSLGAVADRQSGQAIFDPGYARHMIDLLGVIEEKTKGNLDKEEADELKGLLHELRSRFVELSRLVAEGRIQQGSPAGSSNTRQPPPPGTPGTSGPHLHT
ncbi:MAG: DUF1844 domain-containing protein [Phycisphaeraceae bacterium]|nr:MAG: DUF1844 domain-containing protein [Phycisphaeraceae bacterium]